MSTENIAAFLRRVSLDNQLREELVGVASTRGLIFTSGELAAVDFESACKQITENPPELLPAGDDYETDPGFGRIEIPG